VRSVSKANEAPLDTRSLLSASSHTLFASLHTPTGIVVAFEFVISSHGQLHCMISAHSFD
jgi:hypothetical protein